MIASLLPIMTTMNTMNQMSQEEARHRAEKQREEDEYEQQMTHQKIYKTSCVDVEYDGAYHCACAYPYLHPNGYPTAGAITVCEVFSRYIR